MIKNSFKKLPVEKHPLEKFLNLNPELKKESVNRAKLLLRDLLELEKNKAFKGLAEKMRFGRLAASILNIKNRESQYLLRLLLDLNENSGIKNFNSELHESTIQWLFYLFSNFEVELGEGKFNVEEILTYWHGYMSGMEIMKFQDEDGNVIEVDDNISHSIIWTLLKGRAENIYGIHLGQRSKWVEDVSGICEFIKNEINLLLSSPTLPSIEARKDDFEAINKLIINLDSIWALRYGMNAKDVVKQEDIDHYITVSDISNLAELKIETVRNAVSKGEIKYLDKKNKIFSAESVLEWLQKEKRRVHTEYYESLFYPEEEAYIEIPVENKAELKSFIEANTN